MAMDINELIKRLQTIRVWTPTGSTARNLVEELIDHFKSQVPR